jgi:hypothetical protein
MIQIDVDVSELLEFAGHLKRIDFICCNGFLC